MKIQTITMYFYGNKPTESTLYMIYKRGHLSVGIESGSDTLFTHLTSDVNYIRWLMNNADKLFFEHYQDEWFPKVAVLSSKDNWYDGSDKDYYSKSHLYREFNDAIYKLEQMSKEHSDKLYKRKPLEPQQPKLEVKND